MTGRIEIDPEALERASRELADAGGRLTTAASDADAVTISSNAFGSMNSYLGGPIALAAGRTTDMLRAAGDVVSALGVAAQAAADDFTAYESGISQTFSEAAADLSGAQGIL